MKAIAVAILGFSVGAGVCHFANKERKYLSQIENYQVYIDPAFGPKGRADVHSALNAWQTATKDTDHPLVFATVDALKMCGRDAFACGNGVFTIHPNTKESISLLYGKRAIGLTDPRNNVFVANELKASERKRVLEHEIGHILHLKHSGEETGPRSIMRSDLGYMSDGITEADIEQYSAVKE